MYRPRQMTKFAECILREGSTAVEPLVNLQINKFLEMILWQICEFQDGAFHNVVNTENVWILLGLLKAFVPLEI